MKYKKIRHLKLLKRSQDLENQGESLRDENRKDYLELLAYKVLVQDHIYWENRHKYLSVMDNFINGIINAEDFSDQFFGISNQNEAVHEAFIIDFKKLEDFEPDIRSQNFSTFITDLLSDCEVFEPNSTLREDYQISEEELKDSVRNAMLQIQEYL